MCYRDTTFCTAKCATVACPIKLTPDVLAGALAWWGDDYAPVAVGDRSEGCERFTEVVNG
jgi:phage gp46-like protein